MRKYLILLSLLITSCVSYKASIHCPDGYKTCISNASVKGYGSVQGGYTEFLKNVSQIK